MGYNQQRKPQQRTSVFKQNENSMGPDFMSKMDINRKEGMVMKAIRDLIRGNIDINSEYKYFCDPSFMEMCLSTINMKYQLHSINSNALTEFIALHGTSQEHEAILDYNSKSARAHEIVFNNLIMLKSTQNPQWLMVITTNIRNERLNRHI